MANRVFLGMLGAVVLAAVAGCAQIPLPAGFSSLPGLPGGSSSSSSGTYDPNKPIAGSSQPIKAPGVFLPGNRRISIAESLEQNKRHQEAEAARRQEEAARVNAAANAATLPGRAPQAIEADQGPRGGRTGGRAQQVAGAGATSPGGALYDVQALQQSVTWACFARFRPDSDQLLLRMLGQRPTYLIEIQPENFRKTVLARGDPTTWRGIYDRNDPPPKNDWERKLQRDLSRSEVDDVSANTARYVSTLMSLPNAGQSEYRYAQQMMGRGLAHIQGKYPDDRLLCLQAILAEQFGGASPAQTERALEELLKYGTQNGGLSSTCFIAMELANRALERGQPQAALRRLEGLHTPAIGTQAGHPRMDDAYRDFGCQGAKWMQGGLYWAGVDGQRNKAQALAAYRFCSRSLDRCKLNVLLITADEPKNYEQRHIHIQQLTGLARSNDKSVASTANHLLANFSSTDRALAGFPVGVVQAMAGLVSMTIEMRAACVRQMGAEACDRASVSTPSSSSNEPNDYGLGSYVRTKNFFIEQSNIDRGFP